MKSLPISLPRQRSLAGSGRSIISKPPNNQAALRVLEVSVTYSVDFLAQNLTFDLKNGIVIISATLDKQTKKILAEPEVLTRGFIYVKENQDIVEETKKICLEVIKDNIVEETKKVDYTKIKNDVRELLGKYFYKETEAKPMIITVIQEV